jgi:hypothetical protein
LPVQLFDFPLKAGLEVVGPAGRDELAGSARQLIEAGGKIAFKGLSIKRKE